MRKLFMALLCLVLVTAPGCANIQNDATRTTTEGALTGMAVGAGLGALVGGLVTGSDGAIIGAAIGGALGGLAGTAVGKHIADKKKDYASREEWLDACITQARDVNEKTVAYNKQLKTEIADLDKQSTKLAADFKRKKVTTDTLVAENNAVQERKAQVDTTIAQLEDEVVNQKKVVADARSGQNSREADIIEKEIVRMEKQIALLRKDAEKLASISTRLSV